ncbi:hypothetical protein BU26DRAFT_14427 [Trematosphaeria pertusa]|uniref:Zn(2)-C6 fungal-type domain-containing protein n=1 Tax=Trematosphaeria pertusa TaxID=390896 RepID=A0A6A6J0R9_9PLEO|nr:uncharacterized protein BU26DRAFT_14427 [Trematosphaeria pertusa]KAF2256108.1 hypothetical protein BU26DRAFT_14427 [Trematosphaeria pertusa]
MPDEEPRRPGPGRPKLRTSCDGCGAAKLRCDRGQPECGRCLSHGVPCVYGFSRKMGKPPRQRLRSTPTQASSDQATAPDGDKLDNSSTTQSVTSNTISTAADVLTAWDAVDDAATELFVNLDAFDQTAPSLSAFAALDFAEWPTMDQFNDSLLSSDLHLAPTPAPQSPNLGGYSPHATSATPAAPLQPQPKKASLADSALTPLTNIPDHDCPREAYEILGSLSFFNLTKNRPVSTANRVPLDHVLRLSREASERLSRLLTCSCASFPNLALLYASIISRVLVWYQQAAVCMQGAAVIPDTAPAHVYTTQSSPISGAASGGPPSTCSSTAASTFSTAVTGKLISASLAQSPGLSVSPSRIAVGTFDVDDLRVQAALKIQLLLGEMRRAGRLIDQFTSHTIGAQRHSDESTLGGIDSLYQNLDSWLRGEHSRIANMMRSRLRELNT